MDIVVNVNIDAGSEEPKVKVNKTPLKKPAVKTPSKQLGVKKAGGIIQFPPMNPENNPILDMMGIKET